MPATVPQIARAAFFDVHPTLKEVFELPAAVNALIPNDALARAGLKKRVRVELCTDPTIPANLQIVLFKADTHNVDCRTFTDHETSYLTLDSDNLLVTFMNLNGNKHTKANHPALGTNNVEGLAAYAMKKLFGWADPTEGMAMLRAIEAAETPSPAAALVLPVIPKAPRRRRGAGVSAGGTSKP